MAQTASSPTSNPWLNLLPDPGSTRAASERLVRALEAHASAEAIDIATCEDLARRTQEPRVKLLLGLVVEDGHRHCVLLDSMVCRLDGGTRGVTSTAAPTADNSAPLSDVELAAALRTLIRDEHENARHLRHVGRQEAPVYDGLYTALLETIARDSEKHATLLRYLLMQLERSQTC